MAGPVIYKQLTKHIGKLNHSVIVTAFVSAQSDPIKRRTLYFEFARSQPVLLFRRILFQL